MRLHVSALCAAAVSLWAGAAAAQTAAAPAASDEHCLLAFVALSNSSDQNAARTGQTGVIFFAGRMKGRDPNYDFSKLKTIASTMNVEAAQTDLQQHCGPMLNTAMQQLRSALAPPAGQQPAPPAGQKPAPPRK